MKKFVFFLFVVFSLFYSCHSGTSTIVWQIGAEDGSSSEFALAPDQYAEFLNLDFGWEDRYYLIGKSTPENDWPYVLPGPSDLWGGSSWASIRSTALNILFGMERAPAQGDWKLVIDLLNANGKTPPFFKVTVNGKSWKYLIPNGSDNINEIPAALLRKIEIPLASGLIRAGGNEVTLTVLEGSWLVFDDIRLEGPANARLQPVHPSLFIRNVKAADYHLDGFQPLLVDVEYLSGAPRLAVKLDGKTVLEKTLENGRYTLEAPMPVVDKTTVGNYSILVDGKEWMKGKVSRTPQQKNMTPAGYVNTFLGASYSRWMIAPGPWMPFSMVKISPDNQNRVWQAGYQPSFESVGMFSHIHEWTMAGLGMLPVTGPLRTKVGDQSSLADQSDTYRSAIDKDTEEAPLGFYKVRLTDYDILAELTATTRCGFQRYSYPRGSEARVMIDLVVPSEFDIQIFEAEMRQVDKRRVEGFCVQQSKIWTEPCVADQDYTVFFVIEFDHDIQKFGGWIDDLTTENKPVAGKNPTRAGCYVEFDVSKDSIIHVRSSISYADLEGARLNLKTEIEEPFGWDFDAICRRQLDTWNDIFNRIRITCNDRREKMRFYTNFYRSFCRNIHSDVDGRWVDATEQIRQLSDPDAVALGCDAFWNTFWNLNQLWNLATPEWTSRWVKSQLAMYDANGWLAKGPGGMEYIPVMEAEHEIPLLVSAYQMGIRNYDTEKMFHAVKKMQTTLPEKIGGGIAGNRDLEAYLKYKYVPADKGRFSNSLEYAYDDWTVSQLAKSMGKESDYKVFAERSGWWRNVFDPVTGYAILRFSDGSWAKDFDPIKSGYRHYTEGNAWQLSFFVPQDVPALAEVVGKQVLIDRLAWGFEASAPLRFNAPGEVYWDFPVVHGNQQCMHFAFLFNWLGQPWQTQHWSRMILDRYYGFEIANAYPGDEDQGQMGAWFIMAALGLFQTDGGCNTEPVYEIASPLFEKTVIDLGGRFGRGQTFTIEAKGVSHINRYVQSAELNGKPWNSFKFPAIELLKGGSLKLVMGPKPNKEWGIHNP